MKSIPCTRDLEDYTRLWINTQGLTTDLQNGNLFLALEWQSAIHLGVMRSADRQMWAENLPLLNKLI